MAKTARDGASYVRMQKGHSILVWLILCSLSGIGVPFAIYYTLSPNHYWHL